MTSRMADDNPFTNANGSYNSTNRANGRVSPNNPTIRVPNDLNKSSSDQSYALNVKDQDSPPSTDYAMATPSKKEVFKAKAKVAASNEVW